MTLTREEFTNEYRQKFSAGDREVKDALWIYAYSIKLPEYFKDDKRLEPESKKVFICSTQNTNNLIIVERVLSLCGANFVQSLNDADIGVYWGRYICDYGKDGSPAINPILNSVKNRNIDALVFTDGYSYFRFCQGKCYEDKSMYDLISEGKRIIHNPLGYPYHDFSSPKIFSS